MTSGAREIRDAIENADRIFLGNFLSLFSLFLSLCEYYILTTMFEARERNKRRTGRSLVNFHPLTFSQMSSSLSSLISLCALQRQSSKIYAVEIFSRLCACKVEIATCKITSSTQQRNEWSTPAISTI